MKKSVVLCVDDEPTILDSLKIELKKALQDDCLIETAMGGEEALEVLAELLDDQYDVALVICDQIMPDIKGDELLKQIHSISPKTTKIMLTGRADLEAVGNAINHANLYRYITKPWQPEDLKLTVREAIRSYFRDKQLEEQNVKLQRLNQELETRVEQQSAALYQSEEKFAKAFRSTPHAITITRFKDGSHIEVNDSFCNMTGYSNEEIIGHTTVELNLWINIPDRDRLFHILKETGAVRDYEFNFRTKSGEVRVALLSAEIIEIDRQICVLSVSQDITQRKQVELALQQAKEEADRANRAKSQFLANMSHELRTPLNAILGFTQLIGRDLSLKREQQEQLGIITRSGEHLLGLINNILQMSKIEVGQVTLHNNTFDLNRLLNSLEEMLKLQAEKKGLQLIFDYAPNLPQYVQTDESKLRQVLLNLLGNAIKFTDEGGVTLRVKSAMEPGMRGSGGAEERGSGGAGERGSWGAGELGNSERLASFPSHRLFFEVEDTGPGIAPEEMDNLFKAFMQTETGRKTLEGTGLGLPISRQFVQLMGGDITVSSILDQGSIFKFDIEIGLANGTDIQTQQLVRRVIGLEPGQPDYRILVVDDRVESRLLLVTLLTSLGFKVREAENGQEAFNQWQAFKPHLIWMDMRMPVMDGYEASQRIKTHLKGQATVIIALTASAFEEERSIVLSSGCDDFVAKPFREQVIFDKMAQYLGVRYVYQEAASTSSLSQLTPTDLTSEALSIMPPDWIEQLYQAADAVDNEQICQLLSQIPDTHATLSSTLVDWVNNFRCDRIIDLIEDFRAISC